MLKRIVACPANHYFIGFSGGRDSHVLLDVLVSLRDRGEMHANFSAIHVNHGLQSNASAWATHCQTICRHYDVPIIVETVLDTPVAGESIEAFAREARYRLIEKHLSVGDVFLSAHHQRDQAETFLLQLMRGAGLDGLRAMLVLRRLGAGQYLRPLLSVSYDDIVAYAAQKNLAYIEDDSNDNTQFNRNFLRHKVLPVLESRFPTAVANIAQSAKWLAEIPTPTAPKQLRIKTLQADTELAQKQQIRAFVKAKTGLALSHNQTDYLVAHHLTARDDKHPTLCVGDYVIRRHDGELCVTKRLPAQQTVLVNAVLFGQDQFVSPLLTLCWRAGEGMLADEFDSQYLRLKPLNGGDRFHPHTRTLATSVKKCLSEAKIPVWLRPYYLGLYYYNELVAIPNVGVSSIYYQKAANARLPAWQIPDEFVKL